MVRFAVIGINHGHIFQQVDSLLEAGAELATFYAAKPDLANGFGARYPHCRQARSKEEIFDDPSIALIVSAAINSHRAPLGIEAMRHGKDFMVDKPGFTTFEQLAQVRGIQAQTGRIYSIDFCERFHHPATVRAGELARDGAVGRIIQTVGLGPHRSNPQQRPDWFFRHELYGGILCDIASHQIDQFLFFTRATDATVRAARVANYRHRQYPDFEDFGEILLEAGGVSGFVRVDWLTPDGLPVWGDGRLIVLGTDGYMEVRKTWDICGREEGGHLLLVDHSGTHYIDTAGHRCPYPVLLIEDILNRTETAMRQQHCFSVSELALEAQALASFKILNSGTR